MLAAWLAVWLAGGYQLVCGRLAVPQTKFFLLQKDG